MPDGIEMRAQIDSENVRGLLLINGGAAVALLAFLPSVIGKPEFTAFTKAILWGLLLFLIGLLAAVTHNHLRRRCSLAYDLAKSSSPAHPEPCVIVRFNLGEPCVCILSTAFMWLSVVMFVVAGLVVFCGGLAVVDVAATREVDTSEMQQPVNLVVHTCEQISDGASLVGDKPAQNLPAALDSSALPPNHSLNPDGPDGPRD